MEPKTGEVGEPLQNWEPAPVGKVWASGAKLVNREGEQVELKGATYSCPSCGAYLLFRKGELRCSYCGFSKPVHFHPSPIPYHPFRPLPVAHQRVSIHCPGCGAVVEMPPNGIALRCPYCTTPILGAFFNPAKPPALLPFRLSPEEAYRKGVAFLKEGVFVYGAFKRELQKYREVKPLYCPLWLYNLDGRATYRGERGIVISELVEVNGQLERRERVEWYPVTGEVELHFRNVGYLALQSRRVDALYISRLNWNWGRAVQFQWEPLAGAEGYEYQVDSGTGLKLAQHSLEGRIRGAIRRDIGGDRQRILEYRVQWDRLEQSYLLVPVYHFSVQWRGREYNVYVNGESGEVVGQKPINKWLVGLVVVLVLVGLGLLYYFYYISERGSP